MLRYDFFQENQPKAFGFSYIETISIRKKKLLLEHSNNEYAERRMAWEFDLRNNLSCAYLRFRSLENESQSFEVWIFKKNGRWWWRKKKLGQVWEELAGKVGECAFFSTSLISSFCSWQNFRDVRCAIDLELNRLHQVTSEGMQDRTVHLLFSRQAFHGNPPETFRMLVAFDEQEDFPSSFGVSGHFHASLARLAKKPKRIRLLKKIAKPASVTIKDPPTNAAKAMKITTFDSVRLHGVLEKGIERRNAKDVLFVLLHGSGPEDKDSGSGPEGRDYSRNKVQAFKALSHDLSKKGYCTFRFDKRGVGQSEGGWIQTSRETLVRDSVEVVRSLKRKYPTYRIVMMGFSEGANLAISAANRLQNDCLDALVLACCPAESIDRVMLEKLSFRAKGYRKKKNHFSQALERWASVFLKLRSMKEEYAGKMPKVLFQGYPLAWWFENMDHSPCEEAKKLTLPTLMLHGKMDAEVLVTQGEKTFKSLQKNNGNNKIVLMPGINHFFSTAYEPFGVEYDVPQAMTADFVAQLHKWIKNIF